MTPKDKRGSDVRSSRRKKTTTPLSEYAEVEKEVQPGIHSDRVTECTESHRLQSYRVTEATHAPLSASVMTFEDAVQLSMEGNHIQQEEFPNWNLRLFVFARAVKAFEVTKGLKLSVKELQSAFNVWFSTVREDLPDDDYEEYLFTFQDSYDRVRAPLGANVLDIARERMNQTKPPPEASKYQSPKVVRLVHFCYTLQKVVGAGPFFLSARDAMRICGCESPRMGAIFLNGLVRDRILTLETPGTTGPRGRAARYSYNFKEQKS
jgi:hypothetical protein